ncbi:MAG: S46 family peptidase [Bacteroidales bacterium]|nr:S46 family peptidase [Bacteroidales bacterium]HPE87529.1 S46 family peptidase [Bacteroidales bacterium]
MKRMKTLALAMLMAFSSGMLLAGEGMWIPLFLKALNEKEMQDMGMRISAEDIYSINQACLKDAIVIFGGGCTGELISDEGLLLTNHHCGYGNIQKHSTLEHDYLTDGFWAMSRKEELPNPGLSVTLLIRMEDVTQAVLSNVTTTMTEAERESIINKNIKALTAEAVNETHYEAIIKPFYYGNEYYMFVYERFTDVRLVGAPPSNIGKFGGDTDNWMWPRHTGDFSVFRVYADKNNKPNDYSDDNVPYKPKKHLSISLKGVEPDDFTFVFGYPGTTTEYVPSFEVQSVTEVENPVAIHLRTKRLDIIKAAMNNDPRVRIQYSAKAASIANGWKKMIGENRGINRLDGLDQKRAFEAEFSQWTTTTPELQQQYGNLLPAFDSVYQNLMPLRESFAYMINAGMGAEIIAFAYSFDRLMKMSEKKNTPPEALEKIIGQLKISTETFFKDYVKEVDHEIFYTVLKEYYENGNPEFAPEFFNTVAEKYKGDFIAFADDVFEKTLFADKASVLSFLDQYKPSKRKKIAKDPAFRIAESVFTSYFNNIAPGMQVLEQQTDSLMRIYMQAQREMQNEKRFYPDANFTMRVTYGKVEGYSPMDAVNYQYFTTLEGIMEKEDPEIYDYVVEDRLKELYHSGDYGRYGDKDGSMHVCFIASNHTTGGNSGSPVLNADGHLLGLNFDRNWEGTMSDLMYDPDQCRNITLDIRYCLFIIDKFAGAGHLLEEMTIIE